METYAKKQMKQMNSAISHITELYARWAKLKGISYGMLMVLYSINDLEICTQKDICLYWMLPKQTVHSVLVNLDKNGYVKIEQSEKNKKEKNISFTEEGKIFANNILDGICHMEERVMESMGEKTSSKFVENFIYYCNKFEDIFIEETKK